MKVLHVAYSQSLSGNSGLEARCPPPLLLRNLFRLDTASNCVIYNTDLAYMPLAPRVCAFCFKFSYATWVHLRYTVKKKQVLIHYHSQSRFHKFKTFIALSSLLCIKKQFEITLTNMAKSDTSTRR